MVQVEEGGWRRVASSGVIRGMTAEPIRYLDIKIF
jgi:hypothetical protein